MSLELGRRVAFTLGALLVFRVGTYIPLPGIDISVWSQFFSAKAGGILGLFDVSAGGSVGRLAIFALGIVPYVTAAFLLQIVAIGSSKLNALRLQGDLGRRKIIAYTRALTIALTAFQAYGVAVALEGVNRLVIDPGLLFRLTTVLTLTAGTLFLVWLSEQITARGIGNGIALILAVGFVAGLPAAAAAAFDASRQGSLSPNVIVLAAILAAAITALIAFMEGARRKIPVDYPKREIGGHTVEGVTGQLPFKLNNAGLIPTILAGWCIFLPVAALSLALGPGQGWGHAILNQFNHGRPLFMFVYCALIVVFTLFYTAFLIDPETASDTLKRHGGAVRGIDPGEPTASYIDYVLARVTLVGAIYLAFVFILPELLIVYFGVPFYLGGASLLVVVCAIMDIGTQVKQETQLRLGGARS
jgi:preprotein translocase subunit SecY